MNPKFIAFFKSRSSGLCLPVYESGHDRIVLHNSHVAALHYGYAALYARVANNQVTVDVRQIRDGAPDADSIGTNQFLLLCKNSINTSLSVNLDTESLKELAIRLGVDAPKKTVSARRKINIRKRKED